jgi:hypothetical protein
VIENGVVATQSNTVQAGYVAETNADLVEYPTPDETIAAVRSGEADAVLADGDFLRPIVEGSGGEHHVVDRLRRERQASVTLPNIRQALESPAVEQNLVPSGIQQMFTAGNSPRPSEKCQLHAYILTRIAPAQQLTALKFYSTTIVPVKVVFK